MKNTVAIATLFCALSLSCTDEGKTRETLEMHGFTNIQTTGYSPFTCGDKESFATGFRATNPAGRVVQGTVCCGLWGKGCTVRF